MSLSGLKRLIHNIEQPRWNYDGPLEQPNFGADPDQFMTHIAGLAKTTSRKGTAVTRCGGSRINNSGSSS